MRVLVNDRSCCMCKVRHLKGGQRDGLLWVRHNSPGTLCCRVCRRSKKRL